jgi:hypothetical protein
MSWLKVDDGFITNHKIAALSDGELRVWMRVLCFSAAHRRQREGRITRQDRREIAGLSESKVRRFLSLELLDETDEKTTVIVHDFHKYNPVDKTAAERKQRERERRSSPDVTRDTDRDSDRDDIRDENRDDPRDLRARARSRTRTTSSRAVAGTTNASPSANGQEPAAATQSNDLTPLEINPDPDVDGRGFKPLDPIHRLLAELRDRDTGTENVLRRRFGNLADGAFEFAREEVIRCRPTTRSDAALAVKILNRVLDTGIIGEPADEDTLPAPNGVEPPPSPKRTPLERALRMIETIGWDYDPVALGHELDEIGVTDQAERRQVDLRVEELRVERGVAALAVVDIDESEETP